METDAVCNRDFQYIDSNTKKQIELFSYVENTRNKGDNIMRKLKRGWGAGGGGGGGQFGLVSVRYSFS